jgi:hypothetical protein
MFKSTIIEGNPVLKDYLNFNESNIRVLNEMNTNNKNYLTMDIVQKVYEQIKKKKDSINTREIQKSYGNITNFEGYKYILSVNNIISKFPISGETAFIQRYTTDISLAVENLKKSSKEFSEGYNFENPVIELIYESTILAIMGLLTKLYSTCVQFYSTASSKIIIPSDIDKIILQNYDDIIVKFNKSYKSGDIYRIFKFKDNLSDLEKFKEGSSLTEGISMAAFLIPLAVIFGLYSLMVTAKFVVYYYYYAKQTISDHLDYYANILMVHTSTLNKKDKVIIAKQKIAVEKLKEYSRMFNVDSDEVNHKVEVAANTDSKEIAKIKVSKNSENDDPVENKHYTTNFI